LDERRDERLTIAAELHDNILQSMTKIWMLGRLLHKEVEIDSQAGRDVEELIELSDASIRELRHLMSEMRESPLGRGGLGPTLNLLVRDLRLEAGVAIELDCPRHLDLLPGVQLAVYQVAREALINAVKHADAQRISVRVAVQGDQLRLTVSDDGLGFDSSKPMSPLHFGLVLMSERARTAGGSLEVSSSPGKGTNVSMTIGIGESQDSAVPRIGFDRRAGFLPD
jgi:signal transduction histidine kinase